MHAADLVALAREYSADVLLPSVQDTLGFEEDDQVGTPGVLEEVGVQADASRALQMLRLVVDHEAGGGFDAEPAGGEAKDFGIGLGQADVAGHDDVV